MTMPYKQPYPNHDYYDNFSFLLKCMTALATAAAIAAAAAFYSMTTLTNPSVVVIVSSSILPLLIVALVAIALVVGLMVVLTNCESDDMNCSTRGTERPSGSNSFFYFGGTQDYGYPNNRSRTHYHGDTRESHAHAHGNSGDSQGHSSHHHGHG